MSAGNLIAMYHYVRPDNSDGVTGITPAVFKQQLELIARSYRIVTVEEFAQTHERESGIALITFDDAVRDQYDYAFPVLEQCDAPAVVFAPMRPYSDEGDRWTTQHLLHALAEHLGWAELERQVDKRLGAVAIDVEAANRLYHYEVPGKRRLKYMLAFTLDADTVRTLLAEINGAVGLEAESWFMTAAELVEMQSAGHAIGGHGFDHVAYDQLSPKQQAADMHRAQATMSARCGAMARALSYPYGRSTAETEAIAHGCGYSICFDTDQRVDAKDVEATVLAAADA